MKLAAALGLEPTPAFYWLVCGHRAPAPAPSPANGDREILPWHVECPACGLERLTLGYDATENL